MGAFLRPISVIVIILTTLSISLTLASMRRLLREAWPKTYFSASARRIKLLFAVSNKSFEEQSGSFNHERRRPVFQAPGHCPPDGCFLIRRVIRTAGFPMAVSSPRVAAPARQMTRSAAAINLGWSYIYGRRSVISVFDSKRRNTGAHFF
jgi:hypothetical protein